MIKATNVILIHGIWNHKTWLNPLAKKLKKQGFLPKIFSYDSILKGPENALPELIKTIQKENALYLVGHSLGGLMALEALRQAQNLPVERVVCIGSPLSGSTTARHMASHPILKHALGRSTNLLQRGIGEWMGLAEVGVIAGIKPQGLGRLFTTLEGENDGTVLLSETMLPGRKAHCKVGCGHTELAFNQEPARLAGQFLRSGSFE